MKDRHRVFLDACSKHHDLIIFAHLEDELFRVWAHIDIDSLYVAVDIDGLLDVAVLQLFETGVDQGLIQVQDERFLAHMVVNLWLHKDGVFDRLDIQHSTRLPLLSCGIYVVHYARMFSVLLLVILAWTITSRRLDR